MKNTIEATTLQRMAQGDEQAFRKVYNYYWDTLYHFARKKTASPQHAEDIAQAVFTAVWKQRTKFKKIRYLKHFLAKESMRHILKILKQQSIEIVQQKKLTSGHVRTSNA